MNYSILKELYLKVPYTIKAPFSKILRNRLIKNPIFLENFNKLQEASSWSEELIEQEQFALFKKTLIHAYEHTKYYKELFDSIGLNPYEISSFDVLDKIPVLSKEILKERLDDLLSDDIVESYLVTTGGTSGEPTKVMMSNDAYYIEWAFVYDFWSKYGYNIRKSRLATFRGIKLGNKKYEINPLYNEIRMNVFTMGKGNIDKYVKIIKKYKADFIYGYPSAIYNFCKLTSDAGINLEGRFKAVMLISENLYPFQEEKIVDTLKCPIAMFYGHSERAVFAGKFDDGYIFNPFYGVTEVSKNGEPIVTGFINKKTPLIRYLVDDKIIEINPNRYVIEGHRNSEVIYGKHGEEFRASSLDFHGSLTEIISSYQFIQNTPGSLTICILESDKHSEETIKKAIDHVKKSLGDDFDIKVEVRNELEYSSGNVSRKYKLLIQNCKVGGVIRYNQKFDIIGHHECDVLYGKHGEEISGAMINFHDKTFDNVIAYQFYQEEKGTCVLLIVPNNQFNDSNKQMIGKSVQQKFGSSLEIQIKLVDKVMLSPRGKYKMIVHSDKLMNKVHSS